MIERIRALFRDGGPRASGGGPEIDDLHLAAAALLVEAAVMDGTFDERERQTVAALLEASFGLDAGGTEVLIEAAREAVKESSQLYGFARVVKDRFDHEDRVRMIEMLWEVAYADGHLHDFEASLVRRVAGLIYVPDRESGTARKRVLARLDAAAASS